VFDRDDEPIRLPVRLVILTNCEGEHRVATWLAALAKNLELSARAAAGILARYLQLPVDGSVHRLVPRDTFMPGVHARHFNSPRSLPAGSSTRTANRKEINSKV
jgi:hypothetical protein